jgi:branched-chain amino acid transport system permease protein
VTIDQALSIAVIGLAVGSLYAMVGLGLNVIFATTGVLNIAQGDLFMMGTMVGVFFYGVLGWPILVALGATVVITAAVAVVVERVAVRPAVTSGHGAFGWVLSTLGAAIILTAAFSIIMGPDIRIFPPIFPTQTMILSGVRIQPQHVGLIVVALLSTVALQAFYGRSLLGQALGAVAQDREAAALRGIPVSRLSMLSFLIGGGIAALAGFLAAPIIGAFAAVGFPFLLKGFIAAAVGGIPEIKGALVGGWLIGLIEMFGVSFVGAGYRTALVFGVLLIVLIVKPEGLFGRGAVRSV